MKSNIEILLGEWGAWKRGENRSSLGYPGQSAFQRMRVDCERRPDPYALMVDDDLRRVDQIIEGMHGDYRAVLVAQYVATGPVKVKADRLRTSTRVYYTILEHAHRSLAHSMGGIYIKGFTPKLCAHVAELCTHN